MERGSQLELTIERLAAGGDGVAHGPDGRVVFVPWTAPGDRVRTRLVECRRAYARAVVLELLEAGASRIEPPCAVFGSCGGCAWQHVDYAAQLDAKVQILRDALVRVGGLKPPACLTVHPSPAPYGYRSRARLLVRAGSVGYRRRRSHAVCPTARCPVLVAPLQERLAALAAGPALSDGEWELFAGDEGGVRLSPVPASRRPSPMPDGRDGLRRAALRDGASRRVPPAEDCGAGTPLLRGLAGERLRVSAGVFCQANAPLRETLARSVLAAAGRGRAVLELYAGSGFLTLGLARRFGAVTAVESHAPALRDLRSNLRSAGIPHVRVVSRPVERFLAAAHREPTPEVVVLDPPRAGLGHGDARRLARLGAGRIVYLSCDPATLARDLAAMVEGGHALASAALFDLFPQTPHVEALAVLERASSPGTVP